MENERIEFRFRFLVSQVERLGVGGGFRSLCHHVAQGHQPGRVGWFVSLRGRLRRPLQKGVRNPARDKTAATEAYKNGQEAERSPVFRLQLLEGGSMKLKTPADLKRFPRTLNGLNKFNKFVERLGVESVDAMRLGFLFGDYWNHKPLKTISSKKVTPGGGELQNKGGEGVAVELGA
jgi:hypothetical protein